MGPLIDRALTRPNVQSQVTYQLQFPLDVLVNDADNARCFRYHSSYEAYVYIIRSLQLQHKMNCIKIQIPREHIRSGKYPS